MTHLVGVLRDSAVVHHGSESSPLCRILPLLKRVTTVYCPRLPFDSHCPCRNPKQHCLHHQPLYVSSVGKRSSAAESEQRPSSQSTALTRRAAEPDVKLHLLPLLPLLLRAGAELFQSVARLELKFLFFFYFTVVAFVENCWVSPLERDLDCGSA